MSVRHFWHPDSYCDTACHVHGTFSATEAYNVVTCHRCRRTRVWNAAREAHQEPVRDEWDVLYERQAARDRSDDFARTGGKDWT